MPERDEAWGSAEGVLVFFLVFVVFLFCVTGLPKQRWQTARYSGDVIPSICLQDAAQ